MTRVQRPPEETSTTDTSALREELEQFRREKEKIRALVGQIGGAQSNRRDQVINGAFLTAIGMLFLADVLRHVLHIDMPLPPLFSIELGVLLVSVKIVWMIHKQSRVEHFQFWILNSIEFRLNEITKSVRRLEDKVGD
ncbi:MAG: hypothetical protein JXB46_07910 [Candidatus Eisenbacteria bacterium]|nr:hypothetical protein [Candidatus Eisenbacteria bacterium]